MKTVVTFMSIAFTGLMIVSCGSASEKKETMVRQSNRMSDSILRLVDSSIAAPLKELSMGNTPVHTTTYVFEYK